MTDKVDHSKCGGPGLCLECTERKIKELYAQTENTPERRAMYDRYVDDAIGVAEIIQSMWPPHPTPAFVMGLTIILSQMIIKRAKDSADANVGLAAATAGMKRIITSHYEPA